MKKFFLKLKNIFKNKKFCALIIISVFTLSTLGIGIGVLTHALINAGGDFPLTKQEMKHPAIGKHIVQTVV